MKYRFLAADNYRALGFRAIQVLVCFFGALLIVSAYMGPWFRNIEGFLGGEFCVAIAVGTALMILGGFSASRLKRPAFWFALALVGQAVALQMIEAGAHARYQHYRVRPLSQLLTGNHPFLLIYLTMQTACVLAGIRGRWAKIWRWLKDNFKYWHIFFAGLLFFLSSATLSRHISDYASELIFATFVQFVNLGTIVMIAWTLPENAIDWLKERLQNLFSRKTDANSARPGSLDSFAFLVAIWVTGIATLFSVLVYERHPHIPDEVAYIYHGRYFAKAMLTMPVPSVPEAFNMFLMDFENGHWFSVQLPGWPSILALGVALGKPWLVNPILAGLNLLLAYALLFNIYDRRTARIAALLLGFSPWYIFMAMNFMTHTFALTCTLSAAFSVVMARKTDKARWGWIAGFAVGMLSLIRPLEALAVAVLIGLWVIGIGGTRLRTSSIAAFVLGIIAIGSMGFLYNYIITGNPATFPFSVYTDKYFGPGSNALGFGPERGLGWSTLDAWPGHSPLDAIINAALNVNLINIELFGWSTGSLFLLLLILFSRGLMTNDKIMLAAILVIILIHTFYWFSGGPDFGARYWFLVIVPCVALTVRGIHHLVKTFEHGPHFFSAVGTRITAGVILLSVLSFLTFFPWRAIDKYHHYRGYRAGIHMIASKHRFGKDLILIRGNNYNDFPSAAVYNPIDFDDDGPIYAWDVNPEIREKLLKSFSDRKVWIVNAPSITQKGFQLIRGPVYSTDLLAQTDKNSSNAPSQKARVPSSN